MTQATTINVSRLIDQVKIRPLHIWLIVLSFLVLLTDGYDIGALAYAAPSLAKAFHVVNRAAFGPVFSSLFIGMLIGAPLLGYLGDKYGRKKALIGGALWYGICVIAQTQAHSLDWIYWCRLLSGIGIGGIPPNTIALNTEYAPKHLRATLVIIMFTGITFGGGVPGPIAAAFVPTHGWQILFWIGGLVPIVAAIILAFAMPESLRFMVLHKDKHNHDEIVRVARQLAPEANVGSDTEFTIDMVEQSGSLNPSELFTGRLALITPILWVLFAINLMVFYFMNSWIPLIFTDAGMSAGTIAIAVSWFQWGGTLGGLAMARPTDLWGFVPVGVLFLVGVPIVAAVGMLEHSSAGTLLFMVGLAGFCTLGLQFGLNALAGLIYPTRYRSNGLGWAFGMGRIGSFLGPVLGGVLIAMHQPFAQLFLYASIPLIVGLLFTLVMIPAYQKLRIEQNNGADPERALQHA